MEKGFNIGLRGSFEANRIKLTRRRKLFLWDMRYFEYLDSTELEKLHAQTCVVDVLNRNLVHKDEEIEKMKACIVELETGHKPIVKTNANSGIPPSKNPIGISYELS